MYVFIQQTNTFQCVLVTDGTNSFTILLYADGEIKWLRHDTNDISYTQVGFNAGDNINFLTLPGSHTPAISNIVTDSNVAIPGVWMYNISGSTILRPQAGEKLIIQYTNSYKLF